MYLLPLVSPYFNVGYLKNVP